MDSDERKLWRLLFGGTIMTQVALCRFLIAEGIIDRGRLVSWMDAKRQLWEASAGPVGGAAARVWLAGVSSEHEPEFPTTLH